MIGTVYSEKRTEGDLIRYEMNRDYCRKAAKVYNRTGTTITANDVMGHPLRPDSGASTDFRFCMATEESYCNALMLRHRSFANNTLANGSFVFTHILVRGPAIIDKAFIPTYDVAGAAFTLATLVTALQALSPPILCNPEPAVIATQTY